MTGSRPGSRPGHTVAHIPIPMERLTMAHKRSRKCPSYHEPWRAERSLTAAREPHKGGPAEGADPDCVQRDIDRYHQVMERLGWTIWGSGMHEPGVAHDPLGGPKVNMDDQGVVCTMRKQEVAERVVSCINACKGVTDPESAVVELRVFLSDLFFGRCDVADDRLVALIAKFGGG